MKKRLISALLTVAMLSGLFVTSAFALPAEEEMIQTVRALGIMVGDEKGNMNLDATVTRAEFITMAVKSTPIGENIGQASYSPFPDVSYNHWASGYVAHGVSAGYIVGYSDGTFKPTNKILLCEGVSIVLTLMGYSSADFVGGFPQGQMSLYRSLGLDEGMTLIDPYQSMTRRDTMRLFYNMLTAKRKDGNMQLVVLGYQPNAAGQVNVAAVVNQSLKGPVIATGSWESQIPFPLSQAEIYKNNTKIGQGGINAYDVVYWSKSMKTVWVYDTRVTGTVQAVSPSQTNPSSVTVAGNTYSLETSSAAFALSNLGEFEHGDYITLLLGKDGGVAGVISPSQAGTGGERTGIIVGLSTQVYQNSNGQYSAETITILATDGKTYSYEAKHKNREAGQIVTVRTNNKGEVTMEIARSQATGGRFSSDGTKFGNYTLADNVEILDYHEETGIRVYPQRLAGVNLEKSRVKCMQTNEKNQITRMIIEDVTGDMHTYGVVIEVTEVPTGLASFQTYYKTLLFGQTAMVTVNNASYGTKEGPVQIKGEMQDADEVRYLSSMAITSLDSFYAYHNGSRYQLGDGVQVYTEEKGDYFLSSIDAVNAAGKKLTAYYDRAEENGGRIRIIVATK